MAMFVRVANHLTQFCLKKKLYVLNWCKIVYDLGVKNGQVYKLGFIFCATIIIMKRTLHSSLKI